MMSGIHEDLISDLKGVSHHLAVRALNVAVLIGPEKPGDVVSISEKSIQKLLRSLAQIVARPLVLWHGVVERGVEPIVEVVWGKVRVHEWRVVHRHLDNVEDI